MCPSEHEEYLDRIGAFPKEEIPLNAWAELFAEFVEEYANTMRIPGDTTAFCYNCEWTGILDNCPNEWESEGFGPEAVDYQIAVCPECGAPVDY